MSSLIHIDRSAEIATTLEGMIARQDVAGVVDVLCSDDFASLRAGMDLEFVSYDLTFKLKAVLDDSHGCMSRSPIKMGKARRRVFKLYHDADLDTNRLGCWALATDGAFPHILWILGMRMTPRTVFH